MHNLIEYLKDHWQRVAIIAGAGLIVISAASIFFLSTIRSRSMAQTGPITNNQQPATNTPAVRTYTDLYAVSIDNMVDARPVSGVNKAAIVYEAPVEGDITRFLAFFERGMSVPQIGPVRSARLYFLDWIGQLNASYFFHFGGSPEAMDKIAATASLGAVNEDGAGAAGGAYWRDTVRLAPHNAYTSSDNVEKLFAARIGAAKTTSGWLMVTDADISARGADGQKVSVPISNAVSYSPVWIYDQAQNIYTRTIKGQVEKDAGGAAIAAKNIVVISTGVSIIDTEGRLKITTAGSGQAVIYRNGQSENATWKTTDASSPVRFYAADGSEAVLTAGNVWIEVVKK